MGPIRLWVHSSTQSLQAVGEEVARFASHLAFTDGLEDPSPGDVLLAFDEGLSPEDRERVLSLSERGIRLVLLSGGACRPELPRLFGRGFLRHLLPTTGLDAGRKHLRVTLHKLLGGALFGLEPYRTPGAPGAERLELLSASERFALIRRAGELGNSVTTDPRWGTHFQMVVDEMLTNAFFNAPVQTDGARRNAHLDRTAEVRLEPNEAVCVQLFAHRELLAVSVTDAFGSLDVRRVLTSLARCIERGASQIEYKAGGAGLGLFQILESVTHFVINLRPGQRTEMIGLIEPQRPYRLFAGRCRSFNLFTDHTA